MPSDPIPAERATGGNAPSRRSRLLYAQSESGMRVHRRSVLGPLPRDSAPRAQDPYHNRGGDCVRTRRRAHQGRSCEGVDASLSMALPDDREPPPAAPPAKQVPPLWVTSSDDHAPSRAISRQRRCCRIPRQRIRPSALKPTEPIPLPHHRRVRHNRNSAPAFRRGGPETRGYRRSRRLSGSSRQQTPRFASQGRVADPCSLGIENRCGGGKPAWSGSATLCASPGDGPALRPRRLGRTETSDGRTGTATPGRTLSRRN